MTSTMSACGMIKALESDVQIMVRGLINADFRGICQYIQGTCLTVYTLRHIICSRLILYEYMKILSDLQRIKKQHEF